MKTQDILHTISSAINELMCTKVCSIDVSIASQFAHAISAMGLCICSGVYDMDTNRKWFYLDNKHNDYKI